MLSSTVTVKGQVVIPSRLRRKYRIQKGTKIIFLERDGEIRLMPLTPDSIDNKIGFLKTKGKLLKTLKKEKVAERDL
jgi:AbrB family looped-hinge helix DNA binding protein